MVDQYTLLNNTTIVPADGSNIWNVGHGKQFTFYVSSVGASTGTVALDTAVSPKATGTWAALPGSPITPIAGVVIEQFTGPLFAVRARLTGTISSPVTVTGLVSD